MRLSGIRAYLAKNFKPVSTGRSLQGMKNLDGQQRLTAAMLAINTLFLWDIPSLLSPEFYTPAYGCLAQVMREDTTRFLLEIILIIILWVLVLALYATVALQHLAFNLPFSTLDYIFWALFIMVILLPASLILRQATREQSQSALLSKESAAMAERHRIARDLHDTVLKTLEGLAMETYTLQKHLSSSVAEEKVRYIQMICRRSSEQIREVIQGLRNRNEEGGIASQLSRMLETWGRATRIGAEFILTGADRNLPLMISCNLRNVLSEALANIQKHAFASHIRISVVMLASEMRLEIHDNGCGLGPAAENLYEFASCEKFGVVGMKERVEQLDGHFSIENSDGTRLVIRVPIPPIGQ